MAEKVGVFNNLWISSDGTAYTELEFLEGTNLGLNEQFLNPMGLRGTRSEVSERTRRGIRQTQGQLLFNPNGAELDLLLPWIAGGTKSGNNIPIAETVPARYFRADRDGTVTLYDGVKVQSATFSCSEGGILQLATNVTGVDEASSTAPSSPTAIDDNSGPYVMTDAALTVGGTTYNFRSVSITLDNMIEVRHNNSATPTAIHATGRKVEVQLSLPYGDTTALYGAALAGVAVVVTFTNGNRSLVITMPAVQTPKQPLEFGKRGALNQAWVGVARRSGSTAEITFDNDSTG